MQTSIKVWGTPWERMRDVEVKLHASRANTLKNKTSWRETSHGTYCQLMRAAPINVSRALVLCVSCWVQSLATCLEHLVWRCIDEGKYRLTQLSLSGCGLELHDSPKRYSISPLWVTNRSMNKVVTSAIIVHVGNWEVKFELYFISECSVA
jgi:hypothetical protein